MLPHGDAHSSSRLVIALSVAGAVFVGGCGGTTKVIDHAKAEKFVTNTLTAHSPGVAGIAATCPAKVKAVTGKKFDCHATANNGSGSQLYVRLNISNSKGNLAIVKPPAGTSFFSCANAGVTPAPGEASC